MLASFAPWRRLHSPGSRMTIYLSGRSYRQTTGVEEVVKHDNTEAGFITLGVTQNSPAFVVILIVLLHIAQVVVPRPKSISRLLRDMPRERSPECMVSQ
jgi:hypothetical protein